MRAVRGVLLGDGLRGRAATPLELFFDLCFVAAVAQVATVLHGDPSWHGAAVAAGLFVPIWWTWMTFAWYATACDHDDSYDRIATLTSMLGILALAVGVAPAADGDGAVFALAAAGLRVPLLAMWLRAHRQAAAAVKGFSFRYIVGTSWAIVFWAGSALVDSPMQQVMWAVALAGELAAPYAAVRKTDRPVYDPHHIVERYGLFTIIVLGESIFAVVVAAGQVDLDIEATLTAAFGFAAAAAFWWVYFDRVGRGGLGRSRRAGFTWGYGHLVVWAGVAVLGVGTHIAIESSSGGLATAAAASEAGSGVADFGSMAFMPAGAAMAMAALAVIAVTAGAGRLPVGVRIAAALALVAVAFIGDSIGPLPTAILVAAILASAALLEIRQPDP